MENTLIFEKILPFPTKYSVSLTLSGGLYSKKIILPLCLSTTLAALFTASNKGNSFLITSSSLTTFTLILVFAKSLVTYSSTFGGAIRSGSQSPISHATLLPDSKVCANLMISFVLSEFSKRSTPR